MPARTRADCGRARRHCSFPTAPVHGPGRDHLQVLDNPGDFLDIGGEVRGLAEAQQRRVVDRSRTYTFEQLKAPGQITGPAAVGRKLIGCWGAAGTLRRPRTRAAGA